MKKQTMILNELNEAQRYLSSAEISLKIGYPIRNVQRQLYHLVNRKLAVRKKFRFDTPKYYRWKYKINEAVQSRIEDVIRRELDGI